jgi:RNA polymerase sigma-70 factor, ECF subfamily
MVAALSGDAVVRERDELDDVTVARAQRGDDAACRALVERYQARVFALLGRMVGRTGPVEDLAQEAFLRVFGALPRFAVDGPARLSTWILTIATRLAVDELRRRRPSEPEPVPESIDPIERHALGQVLEAAIAALPVEQRVPFLLRELHGLEYREIAETLELDLNTVKSRLFRAREALQRTLRGSR